MKYLKFSEYNNLINHGQENFEFVNVRVDYDNRFFIDPTRLQGTDTEWARRFEAKIQDFFFTIFRLYEAGNRVQARDLFSSSGESNEIFLGYTNGFPRGNGNTPESLQIAFDFVNQHGLLTANIVGRVEDFPIFVPKFGPDLLSDLVASILKEELIEFTKLQAEIWEIECDFELTKPFWNSTTHNWDTLTESVPTIVHNGINYPIILVPKEIVVSNDIYNARSYWSTMVGEWRQRDHAANNTEMHRNKSPKHPYVSKEDIRKSEQNENEDFKEYLARLTMENPEMISNFRLNVENTQRGTNSNQLSDDDFDDLIRDSYPEE